MVRIPLRTLALATLAGLTLVPAPAAAVTLLADCAELTKPGETYVVTADITAAVDACFRVQADRITLDLGIAPLAEGVESQADHEVCRAMGFLLGQGFYYGKPGQAQMFHAATPGVQKG